MCNGIKHNTDCCSRLRLNITTGRDICTACSSNAIVFIFKVVQRYRNLDM